MRALGAVGRDAELAEVEAFLGELGSGSSALTLEGDPGIGKTTIWRETVQRARARGVRVLACRPAAAEAKLSFAGLADMLADVEDEAFAELPSAQRHGLEVALLRSAPVGGALDPRVVATGFLSLVRGLAADTHVLLAIDDVQWLDQPSAGVLAFAARRLGADSHAGLLCAIRPPLGGFVVPELADESPMHRLVLDPLPLPALGSILAGRLDRQPSRRLLAKIADASRGNPFFALEMARLALSDRTESGSAALPVPDDLRALAAQRIRDLPRGTRAALLRAAVLAAPDTRAVDAGALAPAEDADLVRVDERGRIEFTHPLFAAAIYASTPAARRRAVHGTLALEVADSEQRARHLAFSTDRPDGATARELDRAADHARARGAPDAAAELVELALGLTPEAATDDRARRTLAAAGFLAEAGEMSRAAEMVEALLALDPPGPLRARALLLAAMLRSSTESFSAALEAALEALSAARHDRALRAAIDLDIAFYLVGLGDMPGAEQHAVAAARAAEPPASVSDGVPPTPLLADALAVRTMLEFLSGRGLDRERLQRAVALESPQHTRSAFTRPRYIRGLLLLYVGEIEEAATALEALRAEAGERGDEGELSLSGMFLVWAYLWGGRLAPAREAAAASLAAAALLDNRGARATALTASALVHAHAGQVELAIAQAQEALEHFEALHWRSAGVWPRWAIGFASLSAGDPARTRATLQPLVELLPAIGLADPVGLIFLPDQIEALIALGKHDEAQRLIDLLRDRGQEHDRPWALGAAARGQGMLLAARGELDAAIATLELAIAQHDRTAMPFERARTLLPLGRTLRRRKRWAAAREVFSAALAAFELTGATLWAEMARAELARAGERAGDRFELTATERQVAEFAAAGLSNREVAERAFLTVKAVEGNLTRAYRKLGIRSRGGLARALERGPASS